MAKDVSDGGRVQNLPHSGSISLSIVIPAYNERLRISPYLSSIAVYLDSRAVSYEILVVDDGSQDGTAVAVEASARTHPRIRLVRLERNHGKGYAVRNGVLEVLGDLVLFADADGATPIQELERLQSAVAAGAEIAIGSRPLAACREGYTVIARWHRTVLGNAFNRIVQQLGLDGINDTQCGFKLFRRGIAQDVFSVSSVKGYGFDLEILYIAKQRGYRIIEVPINWSDQPGSKVSVVRDGLRMLYDLLAVRRRYAAGRYAVPAGDRLGARGYGQEVSEAPCNHSPIAHRP